MAEIVEATSKEDIEQIRNLFTEYRAELAVEPCFRSFDAEIASLPGSYAAPRGKLLLAKVIGQPVGCIGLRPFPIEGSCEMKRLYVRPPFRGDRIGRELAERIVVEARSLGYRSMRLDSHPTSMGAAVKMYGRMGFIEVKPDPLEPIDGLIYMELSLV